MSNDTGWNLTIAWLCYIKDNDLRNHCLWKHLIPYVRSQPTRPLINYKLSASTLCNVHQINLLMRKLLAFRIAVVKMHLKSRRETTGYLNRLFSTPTPPTGIYIYQKMKKSSNQNALIGSFFYILHQY